MWTQFAYGGGGHTGLHARRPFEIVFNLKIYNVHFIHVVISLGLFVNVVSSRCLQVPYLEYMV